MHTETAYPSEQHEQANPVPWFAPWRRAEPTALQLAILALEQCRKDALDHAHKQEFHLGMVNVLATRDERLQREIARLTVTSKKSTPAIASPD